MKPKHLFNLLLVIGFACIALAYFSACSTTKEAQAEAVADPIAIALVSGYAQQYGVPPALTSSVLTPILNDAWGILAQKTAGNPIAQGAAIPSVGAAAAAANPSTTQLVDAIGNLKLAQSNPAIAGAILSAVHTKAAPTSP